MATLKPFGMIYIDKKFQDLMNANYYPLQAMIQSVKKLRQQLGDGYVRDIKWGDYQPRLTSTVQWPTLAAEAWHVSVTRARTDLAGQPNHDTVSRDDPTVPRDRCALLDACVRKCFNTTLPGQVDPGIPMYIDVRVRNPHDPAAAHHDIWLSWTYEYGSDLPRQLNLTMVCPAVKKKGPGKKAAKKARAGKAAAKAAPARTAAGKTGAKKTRAKKAARKTK